MSKPKANKTKKRKIIGYTLVVLVSICAIPFFYKQVKHINEKRVCWANLGERIATNDNLDSILHAEIIGFQKLVEQSLTIRAGMIAIAEEIHANPGVPITPRNLETLKAGTVTMIELREKLYNITLEYECAIDADEKDLEAVGVAELLRTKAVMLSLASALTLYDNYMLGAMIYETDSELRRLSNDKDEGFGVEANTLMQITLEATSVNKQMRIKKGINFFDEHSLMMHKEADDDFEYLELLINSSPSYNHLKHIGIAEMTQKKIELFKHLQGDLMAEVQDQSFNEVSKLFGNQVGLVEVRKGKLYGQTEVRAHLDSLLKPMDIILEKTPFRLTDKLIPGHFGHVAIWVGKREEIEDVGIWDDPVVEPHQLLINELPGEEGRHIVEALRNGVQLSTLSEFMNIDDVAVLRPVFPEGDPDAQKEAMLLAFRQIGKEYDFNFDVNTTDKIVCSELAYACYPTIEWPTEKTLGRHTISPDNVAQLSWNGHPLELVCFYHDGRESTKDERLELLIDLMEEAREK